MPGMTHHSNKSNVFLFYFYVFFQMLGSGGKIMIHMTNTGWLPCVLCNSMQQGSINSGRATSHFAL